MSTRVVREDFEECSGWTRRMIAVDPPEWNRADPGRRELLQAMADGSGMESLFQGMADKLAAAS